MAESNNEILSLYTSKSIYNTVIGDWKNAKIYNDSIIQMQNKISEQMLGETVLSSMRDYYSKQAVQEEYRANNMSIIAYASIAIGIIISITLFIIYKILLKTKRIELDSRIKDISILTNKLTETSVLNKVLSEQITDREAEINELNFQIKQQIVFISDVKGNFETERDEMRCDMIKLFKSQWDTINILCYQYLEIDDSEQSRKMIQQNIISEIKKLKDKKVIQGVKDSVNKYMDGIVDKMTSSKTILKPDDITFLTLIIAGFAPRAVCFILDLKLKNFYTKRKRLTTRIEASELDYKEDLLLFLS